MKMDDLHAVDDEDIRKKLRSVDISGPARGDRRARVRCAMICEDCHDTQFR